MMPPIGFFPIQGNTSFSNRAMTFEEWLGAQLGSWMANHSRATDSKELAAASLRDSFWDCRYSLGSISLSRRRRAMSRLSRASPSVTSGYTPSDSRFSLPPYRYLNRHHFPPFGVTSRYSPRLSNIFRVFEAGLAFFTAVTVRGILGATSDNPGGNCGATVGNFWGQHPSPESPVAPKVAPKSTRLSTNLPGRPLTRFVCKVLFLRSKKEPSRISRDGSGSEYGGDGWI